MGFLDILVMIIALAVICWLAYAVDKGSDFTEDLENEEIRPLLGVVAPKNDKKEEK
jgi:hypothetical protein